MATVKSNRTVALSGFMGSGKTTVGRLLAKLSGRDFIDLDEYVEETSGMTVSEIFTSRGEDGFREMETRALRLIAGRTGTPLVLALGGGTITDPQSAAIVKSCSTIIYLRTDLEDIIARIEKDGTARPLLGQGKDLRTMAELLLSERKAIYEESADYIADTTGKTPMQIAEEILGLLQDERG